MTGITTISSSLVFTQVLKLKIGKHQFYSLLIIGICLILINVIEFIYQIGETSFGELFLVYLLTYISLILIAFTDEVEKYLTEFNFLNPLLILVLESIFGLILVLIYSSGQNPFLEVVKFMNWTLICFYYFYFYCSYILFFLLE